PGTSIRATGVVKWNGRPAMTTYCLGTTLFVLIQSLTLTGRLGRIERSLGADSRIVLHIDLALQYSVVQIPRTVEEVDRLPCLLLGQDGIERTGHRHHDRPRRRSGHGQEDDLLPGRQSAHGGDLQGSGRRGSGARLYL